MTITSLSRVSVPRGRVAAALALVLAALALVLAALAAVVAPAPAHAAVRGAGHPVVLIGAPGLRWDDVDPSATPALWDLAGRSALASMSVRTAITWTCPVDGWLTVSAGQRASGAPREDQRAGDGAASPCGPLPEPVTAAGGGATVEQYADLRARNVAGKFAAEVGLLGDAITATGRCATAVGPGAALAVADSRGRVPAYLPADAPLDPSTLGRCPLTVVDPGQALVDDTTGRGAERRAAQLRALDARVRAVLSAAPPGATVLLAGVSDSLPPAGPDGVPHLTAAMALGPAPGGGAYGERWLETRSTRRAALVQLTDLGPTLLGLLGVDQPAAAIGSVITPDGPRPALTGAVEELVDADVAAQVQRRYLPHFFTLLVVSQLLLYGAAAVALRRQWGGSHRRLRVMRAMRRTALAFAAVPVATYLANLVPWWRAGHPLPALAVSLLAAVLVVTAVAQLGPWRRHLLGPFAAVAVLTGLVLLADVVTGSTLQLSSLMGYSPLVAGRFYGFGNTAFAVFAVGMLFAAAGLADALVARGQRTAAVVLVAATGVVTVAVDGWPRWGSDFGGVIALVPGFAVLALLVAGARISAARIGLIALGAVGTIAAVAYLDWLRPPTQRSHLGRFVEQVRDGSAVTVVQRKLEANVHTFTNYRLALLVPIAFAFVVLVLMRPVAWRAAALGSAYDRSPTLRSGVVAMLVAMGVGFAVNDSGIAIPAVALTVAIPLILAAGVRALELDESERCGPAPAPPRR
jgi:hypothetical protein